MDCQDTLGSGGDIITSKSTKRSTYNVRKNTNKITYEYNLHYPNTLGSFRVPQLKEACRQHKIPVSGTKPVLIERIYSHFNIMAASITVQKYYRRHMASKLCHSRGSIKADFVNDTDFITLEPVEEIPWYSMYSFSDKKGFKYAFNIVSLIQSLQMTPMLVNPYTREHVEPYVIENIVSVYNITILLCDEFRKTNTRFQNKPSIQPRTNSRSSRVYNTIVSEVAQLANENNSSSTIINYMPRISQSSIRSESDANRLYIMNQNRRRPITTRVNNLFIEFDRLGNYTNSIWFFSLAQYDYVRLYRALYGIWQSRAELSFDIKMKICPFYGPFDGLFDRPIHHHTLTYNEIKHACLIVMENLVYSGIDEEYRKIGAFHALTGLTIVSRGARNAMPWLYESVVA